MIIITKTEYPGLSTLQQISKAEKRHKRVDTVEYY